MILGFFAFFTARLVCAVTVAAKKIGSDRTNKIIFIMPVIFTGGFQLLNIQNIVFLVACIQFKS
jgi:hypothetical protein